MRLKSRRPSAAGAPVTPLQQGQGGKTSHDTAPDTAKGAGSGGKGTVSDAAPVVVVERSPAQGVTSIKGDCQIGRDTARLGGTCDGEIGQGNARAQRPIPEEHKEVTSDELWKQKREATGGQGQATGAESVCPRSTPYVDVFACVHICYTNVSTCTKIFLRDHKYTIAYICIDLYLYICLYIVYI